MKKVVLFFCLLSPALTGCGGPVYRYKPGASAEDYRLQNYECIRDSGFGVGIGPEIIRENCMAAHGWETNQNGLGYPDVNN